MSEEMTVRSVASGEPISPIATRLPWFDPSPIRWRQRMIGAAGHSDPVSGLRLVWRAPRSNHFLGILDCDSPAGRFSIGLNDWTRLMPDFSAGIDHLPATAQLEVSASCAGPVLDRLVEFLGGPVQVLSRQSSQSTLMEHLANKHRKADGPNTHLHLGFQLLDATGLELLSGELCGSGLQPVAHGPAVTSNSDTALIDQLVISLPIELGRITLSAREVRNIECGDVVRPDTPVDLTMPIAVFVPLYRDRPGGLQCRIAGKTLIVEAIVNTTTQTEDAADHLPDAEPALLIDPADIQCTVVAELGRLQMTVKELSAIRAGQSLNLPGRAAAVAVSLKVQGQQIGRGELIAVGDELAVMVTEVGPSGSVSASNG